MFDNDINLIQNLVPGPRKRKLLWLAISSYLVLCTIGLLAYTIALARHTIVTAAHERRLSALEREAAPVPGGLTPDELPAFLRLQDVKVDARAAQVRGAIQHLAGRPDLAHLLGGLCRNLPPGMSLTKCDVSGEEGPLEMTLTITRAASAESLTPAALLDRWELDPWLSSRVEDFRSEATQTRGVGPNAVEVWQFAGIVREEGR